MKLKKILLFFLFIILVIPFVLSDECGQISNVTERDDCYIKLVNAGDYSVCDKISNQHLRESCESLANQDTCAIISQESSRDKCYMDNYVNKGDYSICEKIINDYLRQSCEALRDQPEMIINNKVSGICDYSLRTDLITQGESRTYIIDNKTYEINLFRVFSDGRVKFLLGGNAVNETTEAMGEGDKYTFSDNQIELAVEKIYQDTSKTRFCLLKIKEETLSSCQQKESEQERNACYFDLLECEKITYTRSRDNCYRNKAINENDIILCNQISDISLVESCKNYIQSTIPIPQEGVSKGCDGCILNESCYTFGYRKDDMFCSETKNFTSQKEEESNCQNNFECKSNLCIDSKCIESGFFNAIINWFKHIFGFKI